MITSGTGHRPPKLGGYSANIFNDLVDLARSGLAALGQHECVISGMALGWDQALAVAALDLDLKLIAAIPCERQERLWPLSSQRKYHSILNRAHWVTLVCKGQYRPWKMQKRNEWMVDQSDRVLALWDGSDGGTGNCIRYAQKKNKLILNCWNNWLELRSNRDDRS